MGTHLEKALAYDELLARHDEIIKQNEQLTELQINQRHEISALTSELERCKSSEEKAVSEREEAELKAKKSVQQALERDIKNVSLQNSVQSSKALQAKLSSEISETLLKEMNTKTDLMVAKHKILELQSKIVANEKKINHFEKELHHQMEVGKQAHDEVYSAKVTHSNKVRELTDEISQTKLTLNATQTTLNDVQLNYQNTKNEFDKLQQERSQAITERDRYKTELDELTQMYQQLEDDFSNKEQQVEELFIDKRDESENTKSYLSHLKEENAKLADQIKSERRAHIAQISALTGGLNPHFSTKDKSLEDLVTEYEKAMGSDRNIFDDCVRLHRQSKLYQEKLDTLGESKEFLDKKVALQNNVITECKQTIEKKTETIKVLSDEVKTLKNAKTKLEENAHDLGSKNDTLFNSLNDTQYQLCYLLCHIQQFKEMAHPHYEKKAEQLVWVNPKPSIAHKDLIFSNMLELTVKNQDLVNKVRELNNQLLSRSTETNDAKSQLDQKTEAYKANMEKARTTVKSMRDAIETKEAELTSIKEELEYFKDKASMRTPGSDYASADDQEFSVLVQSTEEQMEKIGDELKKTKEEVKEAEAVAEEHQAELNSALTKIRELSELIRNKDSNIGNLSSERDTLQDALADYENGENELRKMVDELENREHDYQTKTDGLTSQVKELSDTIASFREQLENEQSLRKKTSETYEENRQEWSNIIAQYSQDKIDLESDIAKANEDLQQAKNEAADLQEQLKNAQSFDREALEDRYVEATGRAEGLQNQVNNLIKEIKDLKSKNGSIQDKLSSAEMLLKNISLPNKESTLQQSLERVRQLEVEIMGYKRAIENSNKESEEATKKHEQHVAESRRIIEKTFAELEQRNTEIKNMKEMLEKENQKHKEQNDQLENNCKSLTEEKEGLVSEMASLKSKLGEMESEMVGLKDTAAQCTEENAKAQSQLEERVRLNSQNEKVIEELKVKLSNVEKKLDEAVMYGQKLDEFTDATKSSYELRAQQWEEALGELGHEYRKYNSDIQTLLNNIKQENSDSEESISIANLRTLSESLLSTKNGLEQMLYTKSTLLDHTQQLLQEKTITADKLENHNKILCEDNQKLRSQINHLTTLKEELATSKAAIEILQEENNRLIKSQETIQANLSAKSKELGDMTSEVATLNSSIRHLQQTIKIYKEMEKQWDRQGQGIIARYKQNDPRALEHAKTALEQANKDLEKLKLEVGQLKTELKTTQDNYRALDEKSQHYVKTANERGRVAMEYKKRWSTLVQKMSDKDKELHGVKSTDGEVVDKLANKLTDKVTYKVPEKETEKVADKVAEVQPTESSSATPKQDVQDNTANENNSKETPALGGTKHQLDADDEAEEPVTKKLHI